MANNYYRMYLADVFKMAKTMVIKSDLSAQATNRELVSVYGVDVSEDRRTWRYYMNIAGLYHSTNEPMQVRSVDTQEIIDFTVENLKDHRATRREYAYGTDYYKALVEQYPLQQGLILGILNPVDLELAVNADENSILWIDQTLIDTNELSLVQEIQWRINGFLDRWHVEDYSIIEDLYDPSRLAILYANLPMFILNARLKACHTNEAHSFHIRQFLASNGRLDVWMDYMTKRQQLFFYRNLPYILRNPGAQDTFGWLTKRVLIERNFPLADYTMSHNISSMPDMLDPGIEVLRKETTPAYAGLPATSYTVNEVLQKEAPLARSNPNYLEAHTATSEELMVLGKSNLAQTKVLESKVIDRTDSQIFTLEDILINHWAYLAYIERYRAVITISNPRTGDDLKLSVLDAFTLYLYAYNKSFGHTMEMVPKLDVWRVRRITGAPQGSDGTRVQPPLTVDEMMSIVDPKLIPRSYAQQIYDMAVPVGEYISTDAFYQVSYEIYHSALLQYTYAAFQGHMKARAMAEAIADRTFIDMEIDLAEGQDITYLEWLRLRGLEIEDFGFFEYQELWQSLMKVATGLDLNSTTSLADVHKAMLGIMTRLSSYAVQYVQDINTEPLKEIPIKWLRVGDWDASEESHSNVDVMFLELLRSKGYENNHQDLKDMPGWIGFGELKSYEEGTGFVDISLEILSRGYTETLYKVALSNIHVKPAPYEDPVDLADIMTDLVSDIVVGPASGTGGAEGGTLGSFNLSGSTSFTGNVTGSAGTTQLMKGIAKIKMNNAGNSIQTLGAARYPLTLSTDWFVHIYFTKTTYLTPSPVFYSNLMVVISTDDTILAVPQNLATPEFKALFQALGITGIRATNGELVFDYDLTSEDMAVIADDAAYFGYGLDTVNMQAVEASDFADWTVTITR